MTTVNERPTDNIINTGNIFADSVNNFVEILKREIDEDPEQELDWIKKVTEVYPYDAALIPSTPAIAVSWEAFSQVVRTIGQKHPVGMTITSYIVVYYYHEAIKDEIRKEEIRDALWELNRILTRNSDANGLSAEGATVGDGQVMNRIRNDISYSGGLVNMQVPVHTRTRRGVS